jgi:hypothetical protein
MSLPENGDGSTQLISASATFWSNIVNWLGAGLTQHFVHAIVEGLHGHFEFDVDWAHSFSTYESQAESDPKNSQAGYLDTMSALMTGPAQIYQNLSFHLN